MDLRWRKDKKKKEGSRPFAYRIAKWRLTVFFGWGVSNCVYTFLTDAAYLIGVYRSTENTARGSESSWIGFGGFCRRRAAKLQCIDRGCLQQAGTREPCTCIMKRKGLRSTRRSRAVCDEPNMCMCASLIASETVHLGSDTVVGFVGTISGIRSRGGIPFWQAGPVTRGFRGRTSDLIWK